MFTAKPIAATISAGPKAIASGVTSLATDRAPIRTDATASITALAKPASSPALLAPKL